MKVISRTAHPIAIDVGRMGDVLIECSDVVYAIDTDEAVRIASELADAVETVRRSHR